MLQSKTQLRLLNSSLQWRNTVELRFFSECVSGAVQKQQALLFSFWVTVRSERLRHAKWQCLYCNCENQG
jgi:hypothetical protein